MKVKTANLKRFRRGPKANCRKAGKWGGAISNLKGDVGGGGGQRYASRDVKEAKWHGRHRVGGMNNKYFLAPNRFHSKKLKEGDRRREEKVVGGNHE